MKSSSVMDKPDIELTGIRARCYDLLILLGTFGLYQKLIKTVIREMSIDSADRILDLGAGSGKNTLLMLEYLRGGSITALEIGEEMTQQFNKKCGSYKNILLKNMRIENPLPFNKYFDKVFISFVIHGFQQKKRERIIQNAYNALKKGGKLFIFDWNEFNLEEEGIIIRTFMKYIECREAQDFIRINFKKVLADTGFVNIEEKLYARDRIRLLSGLKGE